VVLFGGFTPYVLRPEGKHYYLVGECYIHSHMKGEAFDEWEEGDREVETFIVR
jgi:hypothetical protein